MKNPLGALDTYATRPPSGENTGSAYTKSSSVSARVSPVSVSSISSWIRSPPWSAVYTTQRPSGE
ncbi:hypothetical protein [Candidatus Palauibacter sp.]|uniref:hypothetical protein n=1 Tax=Candidatus Palauibacter sp. TaxID=3101350 RepID=UPI003AF1E2D9